MGIKFTYGGLLKQNQFKDARFLSDGECAEMLNLVTDKNLYRPTKRGGIKAVGTNPATPSSVHQVADGLLIVPMTDGTIRKTSDGTIWTTLKSGLSGNGFVGMLMHDKLYLANSTDKPQVTDGADIWDYGINAPDVSSITSSHLIGVGDLSDGFYKYVMVYFTKDGQYSMPSKPFTHYCLDSASVTAGMTCLGGADAHEVRFDFTLSPTREVSKVYIFRTKVNGSTFYYLKSIEPTDTYFEDGADDAELDLSWVLVYQWNLLTAKAVAQHRERIFFGNIKTAKIISYDYPVANVPATPPSGWTPGSRTNAEAQMGGSLDTDYIYYYRLFFKFGDVYSEPFVVMADTTGVTSPLVRIHNIPTWFNSGATLYIQRDAGQPSGGTITPPDASIGYKFEVKLDAGTAEFTDDGSMPRGNTEDPTNADNAFASAVLFTEIGAPEQINALNIIQIKPEASDEIVALVDYDEDVLVLKEHSIHTIRTYGTPTNWQVQTLTENIGCDNVKSVQRFGRNVYFSKNSHIYRFPDRLDVPLSLEIQNTIRDITEITASAVSKKYNWYFVFAHSVSENYALVYDEDIQAWYVFTFSAPIRQAIEARGGSWDGELLLLTTTRLGKYSESAMNDFGASDIETSLTFKKELAEPDRLIRPIEINVSATSGASVEINGSVYVMTKDVERINVSKFSGLNRANEIQMKIMNLEKFITATIIANYPKASR